jgi:glutamine synthetase type III
MKEETSETLNKYADLTRDIYDNLEQLDTLMKSAEWKETYTKITKEGDDSVYVLETFKDFISDLPDALGY